MVYLSCFIYYICRIGDIFLGDFVSKILSDNDFFVLMLVRLYLSDTVIFGGFFLDGCWI